MSHVHRSICAFCIFIEVIQDSAAVAGFHLTPRKRYSISNQRLRTAGQFDLGQENSVTHVTNVSVKRL